MPNPLENPLVSTDWLATNLEDKNLVVLDASVSKVVGREPLLYDIPTYIPGSIKFDLETQFCDLDSSQLHAMPGQAQFNQAIKELQICSEDQIVIYDNQGIYSSPRAWWMFCLMGLPNVFVLDGGLPKWLAEGRDTVETYCSTGNSTSAPLSGNHDASLICDSASLLAQLKDDSLSVIDARSQARFLGQADEPRPGVRKGRIPNSLNLPFAEVLDDDCFKPKSELSVIFDALGLSGDNKLVFSCGSGMTACIILLASVICGYQNQVLYDGSWADWGSDSTLPIS